MRTHLLLPGESERGVDVLYALSRATVPQELFFLNGIVEHRDYPKHVAHMAVDFFVDFLFLIDIFLNMCTAYYDEDYEMVLDRRQIIRHYARFWLWIDVLAFFPFEVPFLILESSGVITDQSVPTGVFGMLKLPRLFRLLRVFKKLDVVAAANALRIVALLVTFCLIAHWFACMCAMHHALPLPLSFSAPTPHGPHSRLCRRGRGRRSGPPHDSSPRRLPPCSS